MNKFFSNKKIIAAVLALLTIVVLFFIFKRQSSNSSKITTAVKKGDFKVTVTNTGELEAKNSEKIYGPSGLRNVGIWQVKISDMVTEGTIVDSGQYVATLDRTEISSKIKDLENELEKIQSQYTKTTLDTTLELRNARDELINLKFGLEEKQLILDQSKYEPPATIRQAELDLEKSKRGYEQAIKNYKLKFEQSKAKMQEVTASLSQQQRKYENLMSVLQEFTIKAPKRGMVICKRDWDGKKLTVGSTMNVWDNTVATLPDLSVMISRTYVNEIDISKIKIGNIVEIGVDAFPEKKYSGKVTEVANIGEQLPNNDAKVFEVKILVNEFDSILRPAMTTKNIITTAIVKDVIFIPIECVHSKDNKTFVYIKEGASVRKQQVKVGLSNENEIIIEKGVKVDDIIYLSLPENPEKIKMEPF